MTNNKITETTRRNIYEEMYLKEIEYQGRMSEPDFLMRLFPLKNLQSNDSRYNNSYDDINKHRELNKDWPVDWIYNDSRINLLHCDDETYLKFLSETIDPYVRNNNNEIDQLLEIYNRYLANDGSKIVQTGEVAGKAIYSGQKLIGHAELVAKTADIIKHLDTPYVNGKIKTMTDAINNKQTDIAIGTAKELIETTCKSILVDKKVSVSTEWTVLHLLKETNSKLDFKPQDAPKTERFDSAMKKILGGISSIVGGIAELRNEYGNGHGKEADFKTLEVKYASLAVGMTIEIVNFYLRTHGEKAKLVEG
ncbi:MAG: abortive infection family protein [Limnohabitans sp.]|nr:abortive infection family protein [Limnohabitans sp.]